MSESDKTRQKLIDSMRKTKAGVAGKQQSSEKAAAEVSVKDKKKSRSASAKAGDNTPPQESAQVSVSAYQCRPRVWPD